MNTNPIGVFDSGVGGLTVVRALMERLPNENIVYFGDTARVPYGVKSRATIETFTAQIVDFLLQNQVKALVIACNTIAAVAYQRVQQMAGNMPVLSVIIRSGSFRRHIASVITISSTARLEAKAACGKRAATVCSRCSSSAAKAGSRCLSASVISGIFQNFGRNRDMGRGFLTFVVF